MHSIRKDVFIQQTDLFFFAAFKPAYTDDAIHADLHLLASLHRLAQTQINYLHTTPPTKTTWAATTCISSKYVKDDLYAEQLLGGLVKVQDWTSLNWHTSIRSTWSHTSRVFSQFRQSKRFQLSAQSASVTIELNKHYGVTSTNDSIDWTYRQNWFHLHKAALLCKHIELFAQKNNILSIIWNTWRQILETMSPLLSFLLSQWCVLTETTHRASLYSKTYSNFVIRQWHLNGILHVFSVFIGDFTKPPQNLYNLKITTTWKLRTEQFKLFNTEFLT